MSTSRVLGKILISGNKFLNLIESTCSIKDRAIKWWYVSRKPIDHKKTDPDTVFIFPVWVDSQNVRRIILVKQFRPAIGDYEIDFPAGIVDDNESPMDAAKRELEEETGLKVQSIKQASPVLFNSSGLTDESTCMFVVECYGELNNSGNEESEDITILALTAHEVLEIINKDEKFNAKCWIILSSLMEMERVGSQVGEMNSFFSV